MSERTPDEIQAEIDAAHSAEAALEAELLGALKPTPEVPQAEAVSPSEPISAPVENWRPSGGQEVSLMIRASQAGLVRTPGEPITKAEVVAFLQSKGLS